jgi:hypothetical protein
MWWSTYPLSRLQVELFICEYGDICTYWGGGIAGRSNVMTGEESSIFLATDASMRNRRSLYYQRLWTLTSRDMQSYRHAQRPNNGCESASNESFGYPDIHSFISTRIPQSLFVERIWYSSLRTTSKPNVPHCGWRTTWTTAANTVDKL